MSGGVPEDPPGLEPGSRTKRSRSAGAALSSTTPTPASSPTPFAPPGAVGGYRRAPGVPEQPSADSGAARTSERASGEA
eukprot:11861209-Alexandrium_andersonii.AAC.1